MKKFMTFCIAVLITCSVFQENVKAEEVENPIDYTEEIDMFQKFYEHPNKYEFQDQEGNDVTAFVYGYKEAFKKDAYHTTDQLMNTVRSVQENQPMYRAASRSKVWKNLKVYYTKNKYCVYNVSATYAVSSGKITSGKASARVVQNFGVAYSIKYAGKSITNAGKKIIYTVEHKIKQNTYKTKHTISI